MRSALKNNFYGGISWSKWRVMEMSRQQMIVQRSLSNSRQSNLKFTQANETSAAKLTDTFSKIWKNVKSPQAINLSNFFKSSVAVAHVIQRLREKNKSSSNDVAKNVNENANANKAKDSFIENENLNHTITEIGSSSNNAAKNVNEERNENEAKDSFFEKENLGHTLSGSEEEEVAMLMIFNQLHQASKTMKDKPQRVIRTETISKANIMSRAKFLVKSVRSAESNMSILVRLEEISKYLLQYPESRSIFLKEKIVPFLCKLRDISKDLMIQGQCREALSLLGHIEPVRGRGIRVLSIDGGGTRGLMAIEILKSLEVLTGKPVYKLFDYICGVSTGAVLAVLLGALKQSVDDCKELYIRMSKDIFKQNMLWGTGQLVLNHSYYDTELWETILKETVGDGSMIESVRNADCPKVAVVSALVNQSLLQAYVFRNYTLPPRVQSHYPGNVKHKMWEALRASAAAPGYFEEFRLDGLIHQDGGILMNNPTALAIHECKQLWPEEDVHCVVSLGNGRFIPSESSSTNLSSLKTKLSKIIDSATDTEGVHIVLHDLLPPNCYFRLNPYLTESISLDENREDKINQLENDALMYLRRNDSKIISASKRLTEVRSTYSKTTQWLNNKWKTIN